MLIDRVLASTRVPVVLLLVGLAVAGCKSSGGPDETFQTTGSEFSDGVRDEEPTPGTSDLGTATVYFALGEAIINDSARVILEATAKTLLEGDANVVIEGHCDERGTDEYNLALGERRALAVKRYLTDLGVAPEKMNTATFGESRPAVQGSNEEAWSLNRRTEIRFGS